MEELVNIKNLTSRHQHQFGSKIWTPIHKKNDLPITMTNTQHARIWLSSICIRPQFICGAYMATIELEKVKKMSQWTQSQQVEEEIKYKIEHRRDNPGRRTN
jgi:hypothetical protein